MTGLGNNERAKFLGIAEGKITYRQQRGADAERYDFVQGILTNITTREAVINNERLKFFDFHIDASGDTFKLSLPYEGSVARSIILSLANIPDIAGKLIKINPWTSRTGYTNVSVYCNGQKVDWCMPADALPKPKIIQVGSKELKDPAELLALLEELVAKINGRLHGNVDPETGEVQQPIVDIDENPAPDYLSNGADLG